MRVTAIAESDAEEEQVEIEADEGFYEPESGQQVRKWVGLTMVLLGLMGVMAVSVGVSRGTSSQPVSETPKHFDVTPADQPAASFTMRGVASSSSPSSTFGTVPIGAMHTEANPRALTIAEFMQTSKFSHKMADQVRRLKEQNFDPSKQIYRDPEEQLQAHTASSRSINTFLGNLAKSHPKVAMMLHNMLLDDEQQEVVHNSMDHLTSEKTMKIGSEVMGAALESTFQGKDALKKRLQDKFGKRLKPLHELRSEIFPKHFDPEQKPRLELPGTALKTGEDSDDARLQIMKQSEYHFHQDEKKSARRLQGNFSAPAPVEPIGAPAAPEPVEPIEAPEEPEEEEEEGGPKFVLEIVSSVLATVVSHIITLVIPSKLGEIIAMSLEDLEAIYDCVKISWEKEAWIECTVHSVGAALDAVNIFTKKEEEDDSH